MFNDRIKQLREDRQIQSEIMNIDFPPPSNGIYNNAGSSRQLVNYMEHEDMERIANGDFAEGFFNLTEDGIYKSDVIQRFGCQKKKEDISVKELLL